MVVGVEPVRRKLLYVGFGQAARLGLAQALGQVQQGLRGEHGGAGGDGQEAALVNTSTLKVVDVLRV